MTNDEQRDVTPKATGARLHASVARVVVDDAHARSNFTVHIEHPAFTGGVKCYWRDDRAGVVASIQRNLRALEDDVVRVDVTDRADLDVGEHELLDAHDHAASEQDSLQSA